MPGLTVLSPHRDDAAFSLLQLLARVECLPSRLTVINCFTVSAYAPRAGTSNSNVASSIRRREDRRVLFSISARMRIEDGDMIDAPLRLGIAPSQVCLQDIGQPLAAHLRHELKAALWNAPPSDLVIAPLALGNHIDHIAVWTAATESIARQRLAFYEDLPYASWTEPSALLARVRETEKRLGRRLRRIGIKTPGGSRRKARIIAHYRSQITDLEAAHIARNRERIWVPASSRPWQELLRKLA